MGKNLKEWMQKLASQPEESIMSLPANPDAVIKDFAVGSLDQRSASRLLRYGSIDLAREEFEAALFLTDAARDAFERQRRLAAKRYAVISVYEHESDGHIERAISGPHEFINAKLLVDRLAGRAYLLGTRGRTWMVEVR